MFVSLRIYPLMNGLRNPVDHRPRVTFRCPARPISTTEGRGYYRREGRELGELGERSEAWKASRAKRISIYLVQEILYVRVHVPEWIKWLTEERMSLTRGPGKSCTCKDLFEERKRIAEMKARESCAMRHEGIREGITPWRPPSVIGPICLCCRRPLCFWRGPNPMNIVFLSFFWINQYFVGIVNLSELFL